jgi:hypothetical protein
MKVNFGLKKLLYSKKIDWCFSNWIAWYFIIELPWLEIILIVKDLNLWTIVTSYIKDISPDI